MRLLEPQSVDCGVSLSYEKPEKLPPLPIDGEKMKQVLINLVRNGIEAMPGGGKVTVRVELREGFAELSVEDTGPGLPEGVDIFQLFVTTKPGGTGLGLSIARQIVAQHGGEITAQGGAKGGARFSITLPLAPKEAKP
jgi:signal transduction histidine kinase